MTDRGVPSISDTWLAPAKRSLIDIAMSAMITEPLDSKAESDDVSFGPELAWIVLSDRAGFPVC
jgi:hypothetical protein